eukprot:NODE_3688_length_755_cov_307.172857.p3 GENE.NODE_3688_length_755_cov_307.172857~~NODE_3688_length_755_cov_307.172857.p3  ORF type:complete len:206 (+),score=76.13 NODE_3688_length_755_cov_307.172857:3-620(+)
MGLETFPQLKARIAACGYRLIKVAYRGYDAGRALQDMHNNAIEKRTGLQLEQEAEEQKQGLEDMRQLRVSQRVVKEQENERQLAEHVEALKRKQVEDDVERGRLRFRASVEQEDEAHRAVLARSAEAAAAEADTARIALAIEVERKRGLDELRLAELQALHEKTGIDITKYVVAQYERVDRKIEFVSSSPALPAPGAKVHLHSKL